MIEKLKVLFKEIRKINKKPVMNVLPGQLAFFFILSIPPLISLVGIIGSMLSVSTQSFITFIKDSFPASTSSLIIPIIDGKGLDFSVLTFVVGALIMISNGTNAVIITSNTLYDLNSSSNVKRRIKAFFLVFLLILLLAFIIVVPAFGGVIISTLEQIGYLNKFATEITIIYDLLKLPVSFIFIYLIIKVIYTVAPDKDIKSKDVTYGAIFTTIGWIIATEIYSYYVTTFARYDIFYGSIANLIILLLWVYLLSYIFVIGMALNAGAHSLALDNKKRT